MILEAVLTTVDTQGVINVAPMGPHVTPDLTQFALKPFVGSRTHANLVATNRATIHVTDDCLLIARAVTGTLATLPETFAIRHGQWQGRFLVIAGNLDDEFHDGILTWPLMVRALQAADRL